MIIVSNMFIGIIAMFLLGTSMAYKHHEHDRSHKSDPNPIVSAPIGKIQGATMTSRLGRNFYAFRGIRYAQPPVGELRFKPPVPMEKYEGIYNATVDGFMCPQPVDPLSGSIVSEDCLILNVYTDKLPSGNQSPKRPVLIHLHPGGFYSSTGVSYWAGPQYYMDQDIVLVTLNYRLGSLGFISTGEKEAPGNNGLKDQVIAMRWVKRNIAAFGGDPDSITLQGYSSGAWSIQLHMVSPMSRGLFHKAAIMSGSFIGIWPLPEHQLHIAKKQARLIGCPDNTPTNILKCLKTKPAEELGNTLSGFREFGFDPILIWSPVIERDFGQERFLPDHPAKLIRSGNFMNVPIIIGLTLNELDQRAFPLIQNQSLLRELDENFDEVAPIAFIYQRGSEKSKRTSQTVRKAYLGDGSLTNASFAGLKNLYSDAIVGFNTNAAIRLLAEKSSQPIYYYRFSYQGRYSHFNLPGTTTPNGVAHHDDLIYLFYISKFFPYFKKSDPESQMVDKLTSIYANFAKTGKPIPERNPLFNGVVWEPFNLKSQKYLEIGSNFEMKAWMNKDRYSIWDPLYPISEL